jgi:hypothetical protein
MMQVSRVSVEIGKKVTPDCAQRTKGPFMRRILPLAIIFAALSLSTTGVRAFGTWCAHYGTGLVLALTID